MLWTLLTAGMVLVLDLATKAVVMARMAEGDMIPVLKGLLTIHYIRNPGVAYGLLQGQRWLQMSVAAAVTVGLIWYARQVHTRLERLALGLLVGGALGNLLDRIRWGPVTDFLQIDPLIFVFQVFNVADMGITFGVVLLLYGAWRQSRAAVQGLDEAD